MKKRIFSMLILFISIALLSACNSEEDIDNLVKDYVEEKYGFSVSITQRESVNEGNGGNRTFVVKQTEAPQLEFEVYLSGNLNSKVTGDTYFATKKGLEHAESFSKQHKDQLSLFGYNHVSFTPSTASQNGFIISVETEEAISLINQGSINHLLEFITLVNVFDDKVLNKENIDDLTLTTKEDKELIIILKDLHTIKDTKTLMKNLNNDSYLVNKGLFEKNKAAFETIGKEMEKIGYRYKNGLTIGQLTGSILCMEQQIKNGECVGGYEVNIDGPKDAESLFQLVQVLKKSETVKFKDAFLPGGDNPVKLENLDEITSIEQIEAILANS